MRVAVVGNGRLGGVLANGWARAGHWVVIGSRNPVTDDGRALGVAAIHEAAADADVVVNATPGAHALDLLTAQPSGWLDGRVLLDVSNADDGRGALTYPDGSLAERIQDAFPRAAVVKALNTFNRTIMVDPGLLPEPTTVFMSGDHADAKATVGSLLSDLGWQNEQILDLGPLRTAQAVEHMIPLYYAIRDALGTRDFNYRVVSTRGREHLDDQDAG